MRVELRIAYDGTEPGLAEHRLSLSSFVEPLKHLLTAVQRTGSAILKATVDDPDYGGRGGKLARGAELLDLELVAIERGSAMPMFQAVVRDDPRVEQLALAGVNDLASRVVEKFVRDVEAERNGTSQNASVRRYLKSIPAGVTRQKYTAVADGVVMREAEFSSTKLVEPPSSLPRLVRITGRVTAVGFEPGSPFVVIKRESTSRRYSAEPAMVERAIGLRAEQVTAAVLENPEGPRLLWVRAATDASPDVPFGATADLVQAYWPETMRILAQ